MLCMPGQRHHYLLYTPSHSRRTNIFIGTFYNIFPYRCWPPPSQKYIHLVRFEKQNYLKIKLKQQQKWFIRIHGFCSHDRPPIGWQNPRLDVGCCPCNVCVYLHIVCHFFVCFVWLWCFSGARSVSVPALRQCTCAALQKCVSRVCNSFIHIVLLPKEFNLRAQYGFVCATKQKKTEYI